MVALMQRIAQVLRLTRLEKRWRKAAAILAVVVVFCTTYMLVLPAITMAERTYCGMSEHTHKFSCYLDGEVLLCTIPEHEHSESCYIKNTDGNVTDGNVTDGDVTDVDISGTETTQSDSCEPESEEITANQQEPTLESELQSTVQQADELFVAAETADSWESRVAEFESSLTQQQKLSMALLSSEDRQKVLELSYAMSLLPDVDEFFLTLEGFYVTDDVQGEQEHFFKVQNQVSFLYVNYQNLETLQPYILCTDNFFDLKDVFSNMAISTYVTGSTEAIPFNYINHTWNISSWDTSVITPIVVHGGSVDEKVSSAVNRYWYGVVVEYNSRRGYYVDEVYAAEGAAASDNQKILALEATSEKGFVVLVWSADNSATTAQRQAFNAITQVEVGDTVEITMDPTTVSSGYKTTSGGYGTITFTEYVEPEVETEEDLELYKDTDEPSDSQIDDGGGRVTSADGEVITTKTINGTSEENVFDITLTVQTKTDVQTFLSEPDMAVVIVMDISNTMNAYYPKTQTTTTRYDAAVQSAENFINQFATQTSGISKLGFVAFNTNAHEIISIQPCTTSNAQSLINEMKTETRAIISASGYADARTRFTNVEGGLKRGYDMLKASGNANQYIIFLSDGFPTTYLKNNADSSTNYEGYDPYTPSGTIGADGVFYDYVQGKYCSYGTSYSDKASIRAREMATKIKTADAKIFSIGVDVGGQTIQYYADATAGAGYAHSICDRTSTTYEIGDATSTAAYTNWLQNSIGSGYYYDSTNSAELEAAFDSIFAQIRELNEQSTKTVWTATDPMPVHDEESQVVGFIHFYDKDGNPVSSPDPETLTGTHENGGEDTAYHKDNVVYWDLKKSGYTTTTEGSVTTYYYDIKYRVRLVNEETPFIENTVYETNGEAHLDYKTIITTNGVQEASERKTVSFSKPAVHGYVAGFSFFKKSDFSSPLAGAEFSLIHDDEICTLCHGDATAITDSTSHDETYLTEHPAHIIGPYKAVSDDDGSVTFANIPSGHTYKMVETVVPAGYVGNGSTYRVDISYDTLTVTETMSDGIVKVWGNGVNEVFNYGHILPETGGIGVYWFYFAGAVLMTVSVVLLIKKRKK